MENIRSIHRLSGSPPTSVHPILLTFIQRLPTVRNVVSSIAACPFSCMRFHGDGSIIHRFPPPIAQHKPPLHHLVRQRLPLRILVALWGTSTALLEVHLPSHTASAYHALVTLHHQSSSTHTLIVMGWRAGRDVLTSHIPHCGRG